MLNRLHPDVEIIRQLLMNASMIMVISFRVWAMQDRILEQNKKWRAITWFSFILRLYKIVFTKFSLYVHNVYK